MANEKRNLQYTCRRTGLSRLHLEKQWCEIYIVPTSIAFYEKLRQMKSKASLSKYIQEQDFFHRTLQYHSDPNFLHRKSNNHNAPIIGMDSLASNAYKNTMCAYTTHVVAGFGAGPSHPVKRRWNLPDTTCPSSSRR